MESKLYLPVAKTSDAELRAFRHLDKESIESMLPVFELTRSRKTTKVPNGSAERRFAQLLEVYDRGDFVVDLSTHEDLVNQQIIEMFDPSGGYQNWRTFLEKNAPEDRMIPSILVNDQGDDKDLRAQSEWLHATFGRVAFRGEVLQPDTVTYLQKVIDWIPLEDIIVLGDLGYIKPSAFEHMVVSADAFLDHIDILGSPQLVAVSSSSFPKAVGQEPFGEDAYGEFPAREKALFEEIQPKHPALALSYSDYGSIHPVRYPTRGGSWVPRVDVPLSDSFFYHRYRRDDGGYEEAAEEAVNDDAYDPINCWGHEQIEAAAAGSPNGRSPSFWISVRMNIHMTRRLAEIN